MPNSPSRPKAARPWSVATSASTGLTVEAWTLTSTLPSPTSGRSVWTSWGLGASGREMMARMMSSFLGRGMIVYPSVSELLSIRKC